MNTNKLLVELEKTFNMKYPERSTYSKWDDRLHILADNRSSIGIEPINDKLDIEYGTHEFMFNDSACNVEEAMQIIEPLLDGRHPRINLQY